MSKKQAQSELATKTLIAIVADVIRRAGEKGVTMADIGEYIAKNHKAWKPESASPAVSNLVALGSVKAESKHGTRTLYHVRDFDPEADAPELAAMRLKRVRANAARHGGAGEVTVLIAIGKSHTETMTIDDARALYRTLHQMFGGGA